AFYLVRYSSPLLSIDQGLLSYLGHTCPLHRLRRPQAVIANQRLPTWSVHHTFHLRRLDSQVQLGTFGYAEPLFFDPLFVYFALVGRYLYFTRFFFVLVL